MMLVMVLGTTIVFSSCSKDDDDTEPSSEYKLVKTVNALRVETSKGYSTKVNIYKKSGTLMYCCPTGKSDIKVIQNNRWNNWHGVSVKGYKHYYDGTYKYFFNY